MDGAFLNPDVSSSSEIEESARGQIFVRPDRAPVGVVGFRVKCEIGKLRAW